VTRIDRAGSKRPEISGCWRQINTRIFSGGADSAVMTVFSPMMPLKDLFDSVKPGKKKKNPAKEVPSGEL
jgi:hypothetical protein